MATQKDIERDKELLVQLGLPMVSTWPSRCNWHTEEGDLRPNLQCDPYSRNLWMSRGMRPDLFHDKPKQVDTKKVMGPADKPTVVDAIELLVNKQEAWEGTVSGLREELKGTCDDLPVNPIRMAGSLKSYCRN